MLLEDFLIICWGKISSIIMKHS